MNDSPRSSRRAFLRGLGTVIALPMLESLRPLRALAAATSPALPPVRLAFLFVPNGVHMQDWTPANVGADFDLPYILEPLQAHKNDLLVITGLTQDRGRP